MVPRHATIKKSESIFPACVRILVADGWACRYQSMPLVQLANNSGTEWRGRQAGTNVQVPVRVVCPVVANGGRLGNGVGANDHSFNSGVSGFVNTLMRSWPIS